MGRSPGSASCGLLYVSRNESKRGRLLNEEAILRALRDLGFEIIRPGEIPLATQIKKLERPGSSWCRMAWGLTNILFSRLGATLIAIFPAAACTGRCSSGSPASATSTTIFAVGDSVAIVWSETNPNDADIVLDGSLRFIRAPGRLIGR